jgi:Arc/MetJ-type ribon-helix-helix transcriptional regulator
MKVSVSLSADDVAFLDREASAGTYDSRSGAVAAAVRMLRERGLVEAYRESFAEWTVSGEAELWDTTSHDGLA